MTKQLNAMDSDASAPKVELDPRVQDIIGRSLKAHFDDIIAAPMPDRFLMLLAELEAKEQKLEKGDGNG